MQKLRRQILKAAIVLPLAAAFAPQLATYAASGTDADEWVQTGNDLRQGTLDGVRFDGTMIVAGSGGGTYTSPVHATSDSFQSIAGTWKASPDATVDVRASNAAESGWSDWVSLPVGDESLENRNPGVTASSVATVPAGRYLQYRVHLQAGSQLQEMRIVAMDASAGPPPGSGITIESVGAPKIISRAGWGANERYRYTSTGEMIWPPEYQKPYKIILHHTVTPNQEANPAATVRAVYYYHAVTLGWGDIGYNFLIDWKGNIYEGRAGGANVVGGHALKYNYGSIGIAVLGTYHTTPITNDSYNALVKLVAWKIDALKIDPLATGWFIDHTTYNICAHRDAMVG